MGALHCVLVPERVRCKYSHPMERDQPLLVGAVVVPQHDVWRGGVLGLRGDRGVGLERQTRKTLFVVCSMKWPY